MTDSFTLLFVCTGNTCRSPLAEAIARREAKARGWDERIRVRSAGVATIDGAPASTGSVTVAQSHGLDLSDHRSSMLTAEIVQEADLVLGMSAGHVMRAAELGADTRIDLLGAYAEAGAGADVPDPYGAPVEVYEETYRTLERMVGRVMDRLSVTLDAR